MKLSVSNIAWGPGEDRAMYALLRSMGFSGVEAAPSRLFPADPYGHMEEASGLAGELRNRWGLEIPSMQSIWYGMPQRIAGSRGEYETLLAYTKKAVLFAQAIGCPSMVFGCPKNRRMENSREKEIISHFLAEAAGYAHGHGTAIALEANPAIYGTNYANTTAEAAGIVRELGCPGLGLNLDYGTMLANGEGLDVLTGNIDLLLHVHISEPYLAPVERRREHQFLRSALEDGGYKGYVSLEMKKPDRDGLLMDALRYMREIFL